jgi:hypothetical protein
VGKAGWAGDAGDLNKVRKQKFSEWCFHDAPHKEPNQKWTIKRFDEWKQRLLPKEQ